MENCDVGPTDEVVRNYLSESRAAGRRCNEEICLHFSGQGPRVPGERSTFESGETAYWMLKSSHVNPVKSLLLSFG